MNNMKSTFDLFLTKLEGVNNLEEGRATARCPAHDDQSPSLSITNVGEKVLLHCHAGCEYKDIITADLGRTQGHNLCRHTTDTGT